MSPRPLSLVTGGRLTCYFEPFKTERYFSDQSDCQTEFLNKLFINLLTKNEIIKYCWLLIFHICA
jgi:hypothetical protein